MSLKPYPDYADSGVDWLGKLPSAWPVVPAKAVFSERKSRSNAEDTHLTPSQTYGVLPQTEYMEISGNRVVLNLSGADNMRHVEAGDYVSHLRSFQGGLEYSPLRGKVSAAYTVLSPRGTVDSFYFKYLFKSARYVQALQTTTDQLRDGQSIRYEQFALLPLPLPSADEQREIARFLDRETAEIDAFITDQEELIALLAERRVATISRAVTKGLDPSAPMKDSGVDWLGDVPTEWQVTKVSRHFRVVLGKMLDSARERASGAVDMPYIRAGNIQEGGLNLDSVNEMPFTPRESVLWSLKKGDLLVVEGGAIGVNVVLPQDMDGWAFQKTVNRVRPIADCSTRFLGYALDSLRYSGALDMIANKSTIAHFTAEKLEGLRLAFPSSASQIAITDVLDKETSEIDAAIADAREAIELSKERRAALISAAVTGKIDVRNHGGVE